MGQMLRFGAVGSVGFVVDGGLLWLFVRLGVDPYVARALSFPLAVLVTWALNRVWTFSNAGRRRAAAQLGRYLAVQTTGALCNYAVYAVYIFLYDATPLKIFIGFALGSAIGMGVNFYGARRFVYRG